MLAPDAAAQKNGTKYRPFPAYGFKFKPLKDWSDVPVDERTRSAGVIAQLNDEKGVRVKTPDNRQLLFQPELKVLKIDPPKASTEESGSEGGGLRGRVGKEEAKEKTGKDYIAMMFGGALRMEEFNLLEVERDEFKISKDFIGVEEHVTSYIVTGGGGLDANFHVYTFPLPDYKIVFVWMVPSLGAKKDKKWNKAVEKSMKSMRLDLDEIETSTVRSVNSDSDYDDLIEFHENDVAQTPGWKLIETPSKNYLIKTNSDDKKDINEVIRRLEASRKLYEKDFPPATPITQISVVRICATQSDFNTYGKTGGGVAGYFNPGSEELVLYFPQGSADMTMSVMTHEGFHQYCHFLFNRVAAHRWFDEGHGDYYGAWKMRGKTLVPNDDMKGGLSRTPIIKAMLKEGTAAPLSKHIRFSHQEWQTQGPIGVSCYAQSFSIIYFLREGARGKVSSKYWKKEYADIIPNYMKHLNEGFSAAFEEITKEAGETLELLRESDADAKMIEVAERRAKSPWNYLDPQDKAEIWAKAMGESWGKIDEDEFEERWAEFVMKEL
ncbi:MAG: hypothetical protein GY747_12125 [Planctomycetes bacterium]|nr:hypothetical protein [Planctomycetota bacterium]MCP4861017.1 hypothetical protein [Planctomycetota bacterium]